MTRNHAWTLAAVVAATAVFGSATWADTSSTLDQALGGDTTAVTKEAPKAVEAKKPEVKPKTQEVINPDAAKRIDDEDLAKKLTGDGGTGDGDGGAGKMLQEIVERMDNVATKLNAEDPGADTQENERRIVLRFDALIKMAQDQQNKGGGGGKGQGEGEKKQQNSGQKQGSQPSNGQGGSQAAAESAVKGGGDKPFESNGTDIRGHGQEWGSLPAKDRDLIVNGVKENVVPSYNTKVNRYYEALSDLGKSPGQNVEPPYRAAKGSPHNMKRFLTLLTTGLVMASLSVVPLARGQAGAAGGGSTMGGSGPMANEITPELRDHVKKGLAWLAKQQKANGGFAGTQWGDSAAFTSLAGLALMADGNMPSDGNGEGPYGKVVDKALDRIMKSCQDSGLITSEGMGTPMYGHGFATLFLAEVYGQTQRQDVKEKLQRAIRLIVQCQNKEGGWRYQPIPADADLSVTICQVMALRAAHNAGIKVPKKTIDGAIDYVKKSQEPDGGFSYMLQGRGSGFPRSAAGVACLYYSGIYTGPEIEKGTKYLLNAVPGKGGGGFDGHFFYGQYYAVQAMFMAGGKSWETWWPAIRTDLIKKQQGDGSWGGDMDPVYSTSMALIILQVPNRLLPILQK